MGSENQLQIQENLLHHQEQQQQRQSRSLRSKAAHFVSDVATVILNPISDKPLKRRPPPLPVSSLFLWKNNYFGRFLKIEIICYSESKFDSVGVYNLIS